MEQGRKKAAVTDVERTQPVIAGFEGRGKRPQAKQCGQPLKGGKGKEIGSFWGLQKGTQPQQCLILAPDLLEFQAIEL